MVDIDGNSTQPKQDSNRNSPKNENDEINDEVNNETPQMEQQQQQQQENGEPPPQYSTDTNEETMSRRSSTRSQSPTMSIRSQATTRTQETTRSTESPPPVLPYPKANLLIYPADDKFICPKCDRVLCHPVQIQACGHCLCYYCYKDILSESPSKCPKDETELDSEIPNVDKVFREEIENLDVKCPNQEWNCKWEGTVLQFPDHGDVCDYNEIVCTFDCGAKFQRRYQNKHLDKDCPKQFITCPYCNERHIREEKKMHLDECPKLPLPCPNKCDKKLTIERAELEGHMDNECPRTKILCQFENIGCLHRASREKMPKHYSKETSNHVKMLYDLLIKQEQTLEKHNENILSCQSTLEDQDKRIGDLEKIAHSQLIWRIEDYTRKMKDSKSGNVESLFSPTFVTSKHGYRLCASVCLNGDGKGKGTHMSVFISVLKGQFDALLKWPFEYRVTFYLLDQNGELDERKHTKFSIKPNPCAENEPFLGRPKMEKNASFGGAKFAKHEDIEEGSYIRDDTIFLKIVIDCDGLSEP